MAGWRVKSWSDRLAKPQVTLKSNGSRIRWHHRPVSLISMLVASIFVAEFVVMYALASFASMQVVQHWLLDSLMLTVLTSPLIYLLALRPLLRLVRAAERSEEALTTSQKRLEAFRNDAMEAIFKSTPDGKVLYVNPAMVEIFGFSSAEDLLQIHARDLYLDPQDREKILKLYERDGHIRNLELQMCRKDGQPIWIRQNSRAVRDEQGTILWFEGFISDITKRKQAEEKLQEVFQAVEYSPNAVIITDLSGEIEYVNPKFTDLTGYSSEEAIGSNLDFLYAGEESIALLGQAWEAISSGQEWQGEFRNLKKTGEEYWVNVTTAPIKNDAGENTHYVCVKEDITERKRAEQDLAESERQLRSFQENAGEGIFRATEEGKLLYANPAMARIFGYASVYDLLRLNFWDLFFHYDSREKMVQAQGAEGRVRELELGMCHHDGHEIQVIMNSRLIQAEESKVSWYEGTLNDITHRRLLEAERLKAQKLESIGDLAGGLAHDFNNFLSEIQLNCSSARLALADTQEDNEIITNLAAAEKAVFRAQGITKRLLTFSPGGGPVRAVQPLEPILREAPDLIVKVENIDTTFDLPKQLSPVNVDAAQIGQVVRNLVLNARQAMPDGGQLEISAQNVAVGAGETIGPLEPGPYVEVSVKDQGVGIPPEIMDRMYDPYMSTSSTGNGLGLFICFTILEKHNGWITATSEVGRGSTFRFYLRAAAATSEMVPTKNGDSKTEKSGRILVMDDEEGIRIALARLLQKIGYESDTAADGETALVMYSENLKAGRPYDTVIIDLTIPDGLGGIETVQELKRLDPGVKAIMSSGYSTSPAMAHPDEYGFKEVLVKPYTIEDLASTIERALRD